MQDWFKDSQTRFVVSDEVGAVLNEYLPEESYDKDLLIQKRVKVYVLPWDRFLYGLSSANNVLPLPALRTKQSSVLAHFDP